MNSKPKILLFIDWYLPGYMAGGPIRSCANLVEHLSDEFEFFIVTRDTDYTGTSPYPKIKSDAWNVLADGTQVYYFSADKLTGKNIRKLISSTEYDAVYLNGMYSVYFTLYPLMYLRRKREKVVVVAVRGMLAESAIQIKKSKKKFFLRAVKVLGFFNKVVFHASNETEQKDIERELGPKMRVVIAGNLPPKELPVANTPRSKIAGNLSLISVARIAPEKNLLYALQALSSVREGHIEFSIYGPVYDAGYWKKCQDLIATLPPNVIVNYCGSVESEQVPALLARCHFLFMPTLGENFGHVILQALSAGCPPIISDRTPWRGLEMRKAGWDLSLEKENQFESLLTRLCSIGQAEFNMLSQNAFAYAQHYIHNPTTAEANRKLFR